MICVEPAGKRKSLRRTARECKAGRGPVAAGEWSGQPHGSIAQLREDKQMIIAYEKLGE